MSHKKHSRVGRLPRWQRNSIHLIMALCALSGLAFFAKHEFFVPLWDIAAHDLLVVHGFSAYFAAVALGSVLPGHIRAAWQVHRNRASGIAMCAVFFALLLSGLLLYYGSEEMHDSVLWAHWISGGVVCLVFPLHLLIGINAPMRLRSGKMLA